MDIDKDYFKLKQENLNMDYMKSNSTELKTFTKPKNTDKSLLIFQKFLVDN